MTTHFSILALEIPWTEEPGALRGKASAIMASGKDSSQRRESPCSPNVMNFSKIALYSRVT